MPNLSGGRKWFDLVGTGATGPSHGTLTGGTSAAAWKPPARPGAWGHVALDGAAGYVDAGSSTKLDMAGSFTLGAWVRIASFSSNYKLVMAKGVTSRNYSFGVDAGAGNRGLFIGIAGIGSIGSGGDITVPVANTMTAGTWYRYVVVYNSPATSLAVYQNTVSVYSTGGLSGAAPTTNTDALVFGQGAGGWGYMNGSIDDLFVSSRPWTVADVWADYHLSRLGYPGVLARPATRILFAPAAAAVGATAPTRLRQSRNLSLVRR